MTIHKVGGREILSLEDIKAMEYPTREDFEEAILWLSSRVEELEKELESERLNYAAAVSNLRAATTPNYSSEDERILE